MSEFDRDTEFPPGRDGVHPVTISPRWNALGGSPNGGYSLALALRGLAHDMRSHGFVDPLVVSAFYLRRTTPGPAEVRTEVARVGGRTATGTARLLRDGDEVVRLTATFGDLARMQGRSAVFGKPPPLPSPDACVDLTGARRIPGVTLVDRMEYRAPALPGWVRGAPSGDPSAAFWMRFRDGRAPDTIALPALVDAAPPAVLEIGEPGSSTIELTVHVRARPAPGWLACRVTTRYVIDGLHEEDFEVWDAEGRPVAQARQLALLAPTRAPA
ncbi:MAG: thioesterase family protein [Proteobacteria bacterium]|nr:thioesterase family protein [Pseudomonadota bacterium]